MDDTIGIESSNYRLQHINDIKTGLEKNSEYRKHLSKRYSIIINTLHYSNYTLKIISTVTAIGCVSLLSTSDPTPTPLKDKKGHVIKTLEVVLCSVSIATGILGVLFNKLNKKFKIKEAKHREIYNLSQLKLNTLESLLSKAIDNEHITDEEFQLILEEEKDFIKAEADIRKNKNEAAEGERNELGGLMPTELRSLDKNLFSKCLSKK